MRQATLSFAAISGIALLWPAFARGQSWLPAAAGTYNWNDNTNWSAAPFPNGSSAVANITTLLTGNQTIDLNVAIQVNQLTIGNSGFSDDITGNGGSLTFVGTTPTLTMAIGSVNQSISAPVVMAAALTIAQNSTSGVLTLSGGMATGSFQLTISGVGNTTVSDIISGNGSLLKSGLGTLTLTAANTYAGGTTISSGTLAIGNGGTSGSINGSVSNSGTLVFNRADTLLYSGVISGGGNLTQQGAGTLILTGTNTYGGGTAVTAGTLQVANGGTAGSLSNNTVLISSGATLTFDRSDAYTFGGVIGGPGALNQIGSGTLILTGTNALTGATTISGGTLQLGNGGTTGALSGSIVNNGGLIVNRSNAISLSGAISGTGGLTKIGSGQLALSGVNSFTGSIAINGGSILFNTAAAIGSGTAGSMTINTGTYAAAGYAVDQTFLNRTNSASSGVVALCVNSANALDFSTPALAAVSLGANASATFSGTLAPSNATYRFGGGSSSATLTVSTNLSGANSVVVDSLGTGKSTIVFSGTNNYTGTTAVNNGSLRFNTAASMNLSVASITIATGAAVATGFAINQTALAQINSSSTGVIALNTGSNNNLNFNTPGLSGLSLGATSSNTYGNLTTMLTPASSTFRFGGGGATLTVSAPLLGPSNGVIIDGNGTTTGTVVFTSTSNAYGGTTSILSGTLVFNSAATIGGSGASVTVAAGAVVAAAYAIDQPFLSRLSSSSQGVAALAINSSSALDFNAPSLSNVSLGATGAYSFSGTLNPANNIYRLGGGGGAFTIMTALSGSTSAVVVRDGGNLILAGNNTFGAGLTSEAGRPNTAIIVTSTNGLGSGDILFNTRTTNSSASSPVLGFDFGANASTTINNNITLDSSNLLKDFSIQSNNSQTLTLGGVLSGGNAGTSVQFTNATNGHTASFILSNIANTFQGVIEIVQGTVVVGDDRVLGNSANAIKLSLNTGIAGGLQFSTGFATSRGVTVNKDSRIVQTDTINTATLSGVISGSGVTLFKAGVGTLTLANAANTFSGNLEVDGGTLILSGTNASIASTTISANAQMQVGVGGSAGTVGGSINNAGTITFNRSDAYTFANTINGPGTITQAGSGSLTLSANNGSIGTYAVTSGALILTGTNNGITNSTISAAASLTLSGAVATLGGNIINNGAVSFAHSNAYTFAGGVSGTGAVAQNGSGILTLSGANSYSGPTAVNSGTLLVNGSTDPSSLVTVSNGATLGGTGAIGGPVLLTAGSQLSPGSNGVGTLTVANNVTITGGSGSTWKVEINGTAQTNADQLTLSGSGSNLNMLLSSTNKLTFDIQAIGNPAIQGYTPYSFIIGTANAAGNFQVNGTPFVFDPSQYNITSNLPVSNFSLSVSNNELLITFQTAPVPEPKHVLAIGSLGIGLLAWTLAAMRGCAEKRF